MACPSRRGEPIGPGTPGLVSVVIPTYNRARLVGRAIESACRQTYEPIEIVVVDDGSTDGTADVVTRFDPRMRYYRQENGGVATARNLGLRHARGEFIAFLDSDDQWHPWKIAAQIAVLRAHPEVGMVWTDMSAVDGSGHVRTARYLRTMYSAYRHVDLARVCPTSGRLGTMWPGAPPDRADDRVHIGEFYSYMFLGNLVHTSTVVLRREWARQAGGFDEELRPSAEDYPYHFRTTALGPVALIDAASTLYVVGELDQLTAPRYEIHIARHDLHTVLHALEHARERIALPPALIAERLAEAYGWVGEEELRLGNRRVARRHLWSSLRQRPRQARAAILLLFTLLPTGAFHRARALRQALRRPRSG